jgi:putative DNA primase/helicase
MTDDSMKKIADAVADAAPVSDDDAFDDVDAFDDGPPADDPNIDWGKVRQCAGRELNDVGNAHRLMTWHGSDILHLQRIGWHVWDGKRWAEDVDGRHSLPMCYETAKRIGFECYVIDPTEREQALIDAADAAKQRIDDPSISAAERRALKKAIDDGETAMRGAQARREKRSRFANTSGNRGRIEAMLALSMPFVSRPVADMDSDGFSLNVGNGTLRFREVEEEDPECPDSDVVRLRKVWRARLDPHRKEDLITKVCDVDYDPDARAPVFDAFLRRIVTDDEVRAYLCRYFGYGILGTSREQVFALLHGEGANGKSTLVDVVCRILGDYATSLPIATLIGDTTKRGAEATPDLARLPGARLVRAAEPKEGLPLNEDVIKTLTSSEPVPIRRLHQEFIDIRPVFSLVISANRKPEIRGDNDGIWRRVHAVPFGVQIPEEERDKTLGEKLWAERAGILNWLIGGALDYLDRGSLAPPKAVLAATDEYRAENDVMGGFVAAALEVTKKPSDLCTPGEVFRAFQNYCEQQALTPWRETTFAKRFAIAAARHGIDRHRGAIRTYRGAVIRPEFAEPSRTRKGTADA